MASAAIPQQVLQPQRASRLPDLGVVYLNDLRSVEPLELGARFVGSYCARDMNYPRLYEIITSPTHEHYTVPEIGTPSTNSYVPFAIQTHELPPELANQKTTISGLLPELDLVWFAQTTDLYLWNFKTGNIQRFEAIDSPITGVHVARPRSDVFADVVRNVLVIMSEEKLHIYAVSRNAADSTQITVFDTGFVFDIAHFGAPKLASTDSGRIFFTTAKHGISVYEAIYDNKKRWFTKTSGIVTQVDDKGGWFGAQTSSGETIIDLVLDDSRGQLYTLSSKSTIRAYSYTASNPGGSIKELHTYDVDSTRVWIKASLTSQASALSARYNFPSSSIQGGYFGGHPHLKDERPSSMDKTSAAWDQIKHSTIVALAPLTISESESLPLVGITEKGLRIYFRIHNQRNSAPFRSVSICEPRPTGPSSLDVGAGLGYLIDRDFLIAGSKFSPSNQTSKVFMSYMDSVRIIHQTDAGAPPPLAEISGFLSVNGEVKAIRKSNGANSTSTFSETGPRCGNYAALQYVRPAPEAMILTSSGLYTVRARSFLDRLETINEDVSGQLLQAYGHTELCCAALAVATRTEQFTKQQREVAAALYFKLGGLPVFRKDIEATRSTYVRDPLSAIGSSQSRDMAVRLSSLFDGMAAYTSRLLSEFWSLKIITRTVRDGASTYKLNVDRHRFEHYYATLTGLNTFLENNRAFSDSVRPQYSQHVYADDITTLSKAEEQSIAAVSQLVKSCQQGLGFFLLLASEISKTPSGLDTYISYFTGEHQQALLASTFRDVLVQTKQPLFSRELVAYFVNFVLNNGGNIEIVAKQLQDRCSSYCTADEIHTYKALQCLRAANEIQRVSLEGVSGNVKGLSAKVTRTQENETRLRSLAESVVLLKRAASSLSDNALADLVKAYVSHKYYEGCAQVVLAVSDAKDPADVVAGFVRDQQPPDDPRKSLYEEKCVYYKLLLDSLRDMDSESPEGQATEEIMLASKDEAFHYFLYDWLLERGEEGRLASVHTPFLLRYLRVRSKNNLRAAELLWRHYRAREPLASAQILLEIGCGTLPITMTQRTEYLARAMTICNSGLSFSLAEASNQLTATISAQLTIAKIQEAILHRLETDKFASAEQREAGIRVLNLGLLTLQELYREFTSLLGYHELSLWIIEVTDNRDVYVIQDTWRRLFSSVRQQDDLYERQHFTHISSLIQSLGQQFQKSSFVFPVDYLIPFTESYGQDFLPDAPHGWIVEAFLKAGTRHRTIYHELISILRSRTSPFHRSSYATAVCEDVIFLLKDWLSDQSADQLTNKGIVTPADIKLIAQDCEEPEAFKEFCAVNQLGN